MQEYGNNPEPRTSNLEPQPTNQHETVRPSPAHVSTRKVPDSFLISPPPSTVAPQMQPRPSEVFLFQKSTGTKKSFLNLMKMRSKPPTLEEI